MNNQTFADLEWIEKPSMMFPRISNAQFENGYEVAIVEVGETGNYDMAMRKQGHDDIVSEPLFDDLAYGEEGDVIGLSEEGVTELMGRVQDLEQVL